MPKPVIIVFVLSLLLSLFSARPVLADGVPAEEEEVANAEEEAIDQALQEEDVVLDNSPNATVDKLRSVGASIRPTSDGFRVELPDVYFGDNSSHISYEARHAIDVASRALRRSGAKRIVLEGHADSSDSVINARQISIARAEAVAELLVENGISHDLLSIKGFGEGRPLATNNTEQGRALNRRVAILLQF